MLNQIVLMGRLTKDPEVRKVGEKQVSKGRFTLAVDRPRYGDTQPQADFIPVVVWRSTAEFVDRNFHKGKQVYIVGRLQTRSWEKDGVPHYGFEVSANEVGFADAPQKQGGQAKGNANTTPNTTVGVPAGDIFGDANGFPFIKLQKRRDVCISLLCLHIGVI